MNNTCTVVCNPDGWEDSAEVEAIARAYGCHKIVDTFKLEKLAPGVLVLTKEDPDLHRARFSFPLRVVTYKVAMEMVKVDEENRAGIRD